MAVLGNSKRKELREHMPVQKANTVRLPSQAPPLVRSRTGVSLRSIRSTTAQPEELEGHQLIEIALQEHEQQNPLVGAWDNTLTSMASPSVPGRVLSSAQHKAANFS